jgi:hypothetical protein
MESKTRTEGSSGSGSSPSELSVVESIRAICAFNARSELSDELQLDLFLRSWWSRTYNRPLKDPLLQTYTLQELLYEFYDRIERIAAEKERINSEADKIEEDKEKAVLDWAEEEERKELEAMKAKAAKQESAPNQDPTKDPANVAWMEEQVRQAKQVYGDSFGEDLQGEFNE